MQENKDELQEQLEADSQEALDSAQDTESTQEVESAQDIEDYKRQYDELKDQYVRALRILKIQKND